MSEKKTVQPIGAHIVKLFDRQKTVRMPAADIPLTVPRADAAVAGKEPPATSLDLSGRPKLVMLCGPGRTGKSTLARWMIENAMERPGELALATLDSERPTLPLYFPDCMSPDSVDEVPRFFEALLKVVVSGSIMTVLDFQADGTLAFLLREVGGEWLTKMLEDGGVSPVMLYTLSSRIADLTVADMHLRLGFTPAATAVVLNCGTIEPGHNVETAFEGVQGHSVFRRLMEGGAARVVMPRLFAAAAVESRQPLRFIDAERAGSGLDDIERQRVFMWRRQMDRAFSGIRTWLP